MGSDSNATIGSFAINGTKLILRMKDIKNDLCDNIFIDLKDDFSLILLIRMFLILIYPLQFR
jgi:hypothetical protein